MKEKLIVGYDLGNLYSQISYYIAGSDAPETLSMVTGEENYNIPTALCKRQGVNQWFYGRDAYKHAEDDEGVLLTDLVNLARKGESVWIEEEEFDPVALLTLFVKRSMALLALVQMPEKIDALMITCEQLDGRMVEILNQVVAGLSLRTKTVFFQGHEESIYSYVLHQPEELWKRQVLVCDYNADIIRCYHMECNRRTTPIVAFVEDTEHAFMHCGALPEDEELRAGQLKRMDEQFLAVMKRECEEKIITSVYLLGEGFSTDFMDESLRYLCRNRRVFQGNNLYSKGACYGMLHKLAPDELARGHVFLGKEKLKANIGMRALRQGRESYHALLDAGISWFDARNTLEFYLPDGNTFSLIITPLNGRDIKSAQVTLEGLPIREGAASRLHMDIGMTSENDIVLEIEDLGFGELFPPSDQKWTESFEVI